MASINRELYKNIVFGIMSWYKYSGRKVVYRSEVGKALRLQGAVIVENYELSALSCLILWKILLPSMRE